MSREVIISKTAEKNLDEIFDYLEGRWSSKVKQNFIKELEKALEILKEEPNIFPESLTYKGLRKCVVTKHNIIFYRFNSKRIKIVAVF